MFGQQEIDPATPPRTRTINVLILLAVAAMVFSYLGAYAITNALVSAGMLPRFAAEHDPRPLWMLMGFGALLVVFATFALLLRILSRRQLRSLDALADAEETRTFESEL
jgi:hypothetical protein